MTASQRSRPWQATTVLATGAVVMAAVVALALFWVDVLIVLQPRWAMESEFEKGRRLFAAAQTHRSDREMLYRRARLHLVLSRTIAISRQDTQMAQYATFLLHACGGLVHDDETGLRYPVLPTTSLWWWRDAFGD